VNGLVATLWVSLALFAVAPAAASDPRRQDTDSRITSLQRRVNELEARVERSEEAAAAAGIAVFVIACVCALWAQNTRRSAWLWFFLGLFFHVITLVVLLNKNASDLRGQAD
jgi:fatty acid desaturase